MAHACGARNPWALSAVETGHTGRRSLLQRRSPVSPASTSGDHPTRGEAVHRCPHTKHGFWEGPAFETPLEAPSPQEMEPGTGANATL